MDDMDVDSSSTSQLKTATIAVNYVADELGPSWFMPRCEPVSGEKYSGDTKLEEYPECLGDKSLEEVRTPLLVSRPHPTRSRFPDNQRCKAERR